MVDRSRQKAPARHGAKGRPPAATARKPRAPLPPAVILVTILGAAAVLQGAALALPFFADDYLFLDTLRGRSLIGAWTAPDPIRNFWRPIGRQLYFWVIARLGESPWVAHAVNLGLFLAILAALFALARRLAGVRPAAIACSIVALHYAADVPVRWASGSQDLIAIALALAALLALGRGRRWWAALLLGLGLLGKETVAVTPAVALAMEHRRGEPWSRAVRRAWPLGAVVLVWAPVWLVAMHGRTGGTLHMSLDAVPAALVHFAQAAVGAEWLPGSLAGVGALLPPLVPLALVAAAIGLAADRPRARASAATGPAAPAPDPVAVGLTWAVAGAIPVAAAAHIWSAYYYLFALCGLALALGALLARRAAALTLAAVVALACGSAHGRRMQAFSTAPGNWNTASHFNRFYFDRSMSWMSRYLDDLRRQCPALPPRSTLFFAGIPAFAAWQIGDGPLVRWAYRDTTLRSYWLSGFSAERARRGPVLVFYARNDSLVEAASGPATFGFIAATQQLSEHFGVARDAVGLASAGQPDDARLAYWSAWLSRALGDTTRSLAELAKAGCAARAGPSPRLAAARSQAAAGDTSGAVRELLAAVREAALDPAAHAALSDLLRARNPRSTAGATEALAARLLAPEDPRAWRRWALVQFDGYHPQEACASLARYFGLAGEAGRADTQAQRLYAVLRSANPGGELAQRSLGWRPSSAP